MATRAGQQNPSYSSTGSMGYGAPVPYKSTLDCLFESLNTLVVNPLTNLVTNRIALPVLTKLYSFVGNSAVQIARKVHSPTADKMQESLNDPLSTETLLSGLDSVQNTSLQWGLRSPSPRSGAHYLDICTIIAGRRIYIFASDAKVLLNTPANLRSLTDKICITAGEEFVNPRIPNEGELRGRSLNPSAKRSATPMSKVGGPQAENALNMLRQNAHNLINQKEKIVRQKIVAEAAHSLCGGLISSTVRNGTKAVLIYGCYKLVGGSAALLSSVVSEELIKTASAGLSTYGAFLLLRCSKTVDNFFNSNQNLDVQGSSLREEPRCFGEEDVIQVIENVKKEFGQSPNLNHFTNRVADLSLEMKFEDGDQIFFRNQSGGLV